MAWLSCTELDKAVVHVIRFTMVVIVESLKNVVHGRREWQTTSVFLLENPMNTMKRQKDRTLKDELPRSVGTQYATGDQ